MPGTMELARRLGCGPIVAFSEGRIELYRAALVLIILVLEDKPVMNILKLVLLSLLRLTSFGIIKGCAIHLHLVPPGSQSRRGLMDVQAFLRSRGALVWSADGRYRFWRRRVQKHEAR